MNLFMELKHFCQGIYMENIQCDEVKTSKWKWKHKPSFDALECLNENFS